MMDTTVIVCCCLLSTMSHVPLVLLIPVLVAAMRPVVRVQQGLLAGEERATVPGDVLYTIFRGIPFARPPLGTLRFRAPQPASSWNGTLDATQFGQRCVQMINNTVVGQEDCLYLNVYTPQVSPSVLQPVMVWIHGGAFQTGSGADFGPDYLILRRVLLVTFNYRLGSLGFMSLLHPEIPGNAGLKDQVMVLKWVQQNIAQFGGDPDSVTIFGHSAGGASAHAHMLSPMSKGLFHRVISQSVTMLSYLIIDENPVEKARRLTTAVQCTQSEDAEVAACLRELPAQQIVEVDNKLNRIQIQQFFPVVEGAASGIELFLPDFPIKLIEKGRFHKVPFIAGTTNAEGLFVLAEFLDKLKIINGELMTVILGAMNIIDRVLYMFGMDIILVLTLQALINVISDVVTWPIVRTLNLQSSWMVQPQYLYSFSFEGEFNYVKKRYEPFIQNIPGVTHGDDINYLFRTGKNDTIRAVEGLALTTRSRMVKMWTDFARMSNPTPEWDPLLNITWNPYTQFEKTYLDINQSLTMKHYSIWFQELIFPFINLLMVLLGMQSSLF